VTVGWAAHCTDGVVVASDSLFTMNPGDGGPLHCHARGKIEWVGQRIALMWSGTFLEDTWAAGLPPAATDDASVDDVARRVAAYLKPINIRTPNPHPLELGLGIPDVYEALIAGGPLGQVPELLVARGDGQPPTRLAGQVVLTAMGRGYAKRRGIEILAPNPARTVEEAAILGVRTVRDVIYGLYADGGRSCLRDYFPDGFDAAGQIPPAAFPIHIAAITADDTQETVVHNPDGDEL